MDSKPVEQNVSAEQIEAVVREATALAAALRAARTVRLALFLALIVVVVGIAWVFYQKYNQVTSDKNIDKVLELAQKSFDQRKERYRREVEQLLDKVTPPIMAAFQAQATRDMPQYLKRVDKERNEFVNEMEKKFRDRLDQFYDEKFRARYQKVLEREFPAAKNKELHAAILVNTDLAVKRLLKKYYVEDLRDELLMAFHTWDTFPPAGPHQKGDPSYEDQFMGTLLELLAYKLTPPRQ
jgi:hypothetical protein